MLFVSGQSCCRRRQSYSIASGHGHSQQGAMYFTLPLLYIVYISHTLLHCRLASLEEGEASLPSSLVLLHVCPQSGGVHVAGHVRLIAAAGTAMAVLVEACECVHVDRLCLTQLYSLSAAVLVSRELRGQGHGGRLMRAAEEHAACLNCRTVHLSTHDRQGFYHHLGYREGPPTTGLRRCVARLSSEQVRVWMFYLYITYFLPLPSIGPERPVRGSFTCSVTCSPPHTIPTFLHFTFTLCLFL